MRKLEGWKAVVSVPSQRKAWEVYPLEVYYPDDPTRLCRPKAGQSPEMKKAASVASALVLFFPLSVLIFGLYTSKTG